MHNILQSLGQAKVFSKADLAQGYFQIAVRQEDKEKTALVTANGMYVFTVIPMGMRNSPAFFQSMMDKVLAALLRNTSSTLTALQNANLSIKLTKSKFLLNSVEYLGFLVFAQGISANPEKLKPIIQY
ncbi:hypothetical protein [Parasitella parasitica]|uniref:Reverse transcriptase domain-containing protein n=1 Tax=Parasitella parasitica TaxID=35722 RepID=A0A0B7N813_9FUNG|nr:hypothetical protein [Parasitella parasitica]